MYNTAKARSAERRRLVSLALALGPASTRRALLAIDDHETVMRASWPARLAYAFWEGAGSSAELLRRAARLERALERIGARAVLASEPAYPAPVTRLASAPAVLFVRGTLPSDASQVAIVGARAARRASIEATRGLARELAEAGHIILSGGAIGVDAAAHEGALEGGGRTVAVLACGLDRPYPERNLELLERLVARGGALVSPYRPGEPPRRRHFPRRNGLIAAWSSAVVVIDAGARSGALDTARQATRLSVPVLALPGSPGTAALLAGGAGRICTAADVLAVLSGEPPRRGPAEPDEPDQRAALALLRAGPGTPEMLARNLGWTLSRAAATLIRLEIGGWACPLPGGRHAATIAAPPPGIRTADEHGLGRRR